MTSSSPISIRLMGVPWKSPPWRLALVMVMQYIEGLTDRQAADAVRRCIDWKFALSLELTDPGFDFTLLHQLFHLARAQGIRHIPTRAGQDDVLLNMGPVKLTMSAPSLVLSPAGYQGQIIAEITSKGNLRQNPESPESQKSSGRW